MSDSMQELIKSFKAHYGRLPTEGEVMTLITGTPGDVNDLLKKLRKEKYVIITDDATEISYGDNQHMELNL